LANDHYTEGAEMIDKVLGAVYMEVQLPSGLPGVPVHPAAAPALAWASSSSR
jgi:hypothetical protein